MIEMKNGPRPRPCYLVRYNRRSGEKTKQKALFHRWTLEQEPIGEGNLVGSHPAGQWSTTQAILELEDGRIVLVNPESIQFTGTRGIMNQYAWEEPPEEAEQ